MQGFWLEKEIATDSVGSACYVYRIINSIVFKVKFKLFRQTHRNYRMSSKNNIGLGGLDLEGRTYISISVIYVNSIIVSLYM